MRDGPAGGCGVVGSDESSTTTTASEGVITGDGGNNMSAAVGDAPGLGGRGVDNAAWDTVESTAAGLGVCAGGDEPRDCSLYTASARSPLNDKGVSYYFKVSW